MRKLLALALAICLAAAPVFAISSKHQKALRATFVLSGRSEERGTTNHQLCTAFAYKKVADGYNLLTEGHCFTAEAPEDAKYFVTEDVDGPSVGDVDVLRHVDDGKIDIAELHLKTKKQYPVLELDSQHAKIDDRVFYVGFPEILVKNLQTGRVSSGTMRTPGRSTVDPCDICIGRILIQAGGGPGASGSAIVSERTGKVVGVLEGEVFLNGVVVVPSDAIIEYLKK